MRWRAAKRLATGGNVSFVSASTNTPLNTPIVNPGERIALVAGPVTNLMVYTLAGAYVGSGSSVYAAYFSGADYFVIGTVSAGVKMIDLT